MKTGIYLTPGAARTAYYVGALHALMTQTDIRFDVIAGTSVGAINGAFAAMGATNKLVEIWQNWTTKDVMVNDYKAILKGAGWWAKNFSSNEPEYQTGVRDYIFEDKIKEDMTFRFSIANLTTGESQIVQYPGEEIPIQKAIMAAVSVPVVFEPVEIDGSQYVDGLAIEGCMLEEMLLSTGVDRAFVLGVSPRTSLPNPARSAYKSLLAALEWNQYSEPLTAINEAEETNQRIENWHQKKQSLKQAIGSLEIGETEKNLVHQMIDEAFNSSEFPFDRNRVEIIPVMPEKPIEIWFGDFDSKRSKKLIAQGREDVLKIFEEV